MQGFEWFSVHELVIVERPMLTWAQFEKILHMEEVETRKKRLQT